MIDASLRTRLTIVSLIVLAITSCKCGDKHKPNKPTNPEKPPIGPIIKDACTESFSTIVVNGITYRDLNRNGKLDVYENYKLPISERVQYLIDHMTIEEKAGLMLHPTMPLTSDGRVDKEQVKKLIIDNHISAFLTTQSGADPQKMAEDNNNVQALASYSRWGIPISISTNPRNHIISRPLYDFSLEPGAFTAWPGTLGFAAMGLQSDRQLSYFNQEAKVRSNKSNKNNNRSKVKQAKAVKNNTSIIEEFSEIVRKEYRAVGIHISFAPQADIASEPRWGRISGTFGEHPDVVTDMTGAYIEGLQNNKNGNGLNRESVIAVLKHFPGAGPQSQGIDSANAFNKEQIYPYFGFDIHLQPFAKNLKKASKTPLAVMPYYGVPDLAFHTQADGNVIDIPGEAFHYNKTVLQTILRNEYAFNGVIISDWGILDNCDGACAEGLSDKELANNVSANKLPFGMPWTMELESVRARIIKAVNAGVDQFGGLSDPSELIAAIQSGEITMSRLNEAARRILTQKMQLELFESVCVSTKPQDIDNVFKNQTNIAKAKQAQRKSQVLLRNANGILPVTDLDSKRVFVYGVKDVNKLERKYGFTAITNIADINNADMAIIRINTPYEMTSRFPFGQIPFGQLALLSPEELDGNNHRPISSESGAIEYTTEYKGSDDYAIIKQAQQAGIPIVLSIYMDRPMIITELAQDNNIIILANFGAEDDAVFDIINGKSKAAGRLPFDLPISWNYVLIQDSDKPFDSAVPSSEFVYGTGILLP